MKKKQYLRPSVEVVELRQQQHLLAGSSVTKSGSIDDYEDGDFSWAREDDFQDFDLDE